MALQMGEVEVKIKANVDEAKADLSSLENQDISVSATVEVDTSELDSLQNDDSFSVTVSAKADTTQAEASITEVEKDEYNAEIDTDADTLEAETNIATVENDEYSATVDTDADTEEAKTNIETVENDEYNAEINTEALTDVAKADIVEVEKDDYEAKIDTEALTSSAKEDIEAVEQDDYNAEIDTEALTSGAKADIEAVENDEYNATVDTDADTQEAEADISTVENDKYDATIDTDADTSVAEADISTVENDEYNATIDTGANTTLAEASIADVEKDDYNATVKADADTKEANDKLDEAAKERTVKIKAVLTGIGNVYKEMYELATGAAKYGDDVMTAATEMGITNKQYQELLYTEGLGDVSVGEWEMMYKTFFNRYSSANKDFLAGLETLKINPEDYNGDYFSMIVDTLSALEKYKGKDKEDIFGQIFNGKTLETANKLVGSMGKFKELWKEANETGFVKSDEELATMGSLADELDRLSAAWSSLKTELGTNLAPALTGILEQITPLVQEVTAIFKDGEVSDEEAQNLGAKLGTAFTDCLEKALGVGGSVLTTLANALPEVIEGINWADTISTSLSCLGTVVSKLITDINWGDVLLQICQGLGDGTTGFAESLGSALITAIPWLGDILEFLGFDVNKGEETIDVDPNKYDFSKVNGSGRDNIPAGKGGKGATTVNDPGKITNGEMSTFEVTIDDKGDPLLVETTNDKTDELIDGVAAVGDELSETPAPEVKVTNNVTVNCNGTEASASTSTTSEVGKYNQNKADGKSFSNGAGRGK